MYACQWHFDVPFGQQKDALAIMKEWDAAMRASPEYPKDRGTRLMVGHVGVSPAHVVVEHLFDSLADFERVLHEVAAGKFHEFSERIAPFIVSGSQHWKIMRIVP